EGNDLSALEIHFDAPAENNAAHAFVTACPQRLTRRLPGRRGLVDRAFAGDDEVSRAEADVEVETPEDFPRPRNQLRAEQRERGPDTARRPGARKPCGRRELLHCGETALEQLDLLRRRALLRSEEPGRIQERRQRVAEDGRRRGQLVQRFSEAGAAVHRGGAAETDEQSVGGYLRDQLSQPVAGGREGVEPSRVE